MLIVKTPFRMSFFGGGTDVKEYYEEHGGAVLSTTFDKYSYLIMRFRPPFFEKSGKVLYNKVEEFNDPKDIEHPIVREALKLYKINDKRTFVAAEVLLIYHTKVLTSCSVL